MHCRGPVRKQDHRNANAGSPSRGSPRDVLAAARDAWPSRRPASYFLGGGSQSFSHFVSQVKSESTRRPGRSVDALTSSPEA